jgi:hypothetical protein
MQWGGEVASTMRGGDLVPGFVTLYAHDGMTKLVRTHRLVADSAGNIEFLDAFWPLNSDAQKPAPHAPALLVYADLLAKGDPRTIQTAKAIYEKHLV